MIIIIYLYKFDKIYYKVFLYKCFIMNQNNINNNLLKAVDCIENIKDKITDNEYMTLYNSLMVINNEIDNYNLKYNNHNLNNNFNNIQSEPNINNHSNIIQNQNNSQSLNILNEYIISESERNFINMNIKYLLNTFESYKIDRQIIEVLSKHINNAAIKLKKCNRIIEYNELDGFWINILGILDNYYYDNGLDYFRKNINVILSIINLKYNENYIPKFKKFDKDFLDVQHRLFMRCCIQ